MDVGDFVPASAVAGAVTAEGVEVTFAVAGVVPVAVVVVAVVVVAVVVATGVVGAVAELVAAFGDSLGGAVAEGSPEEMDTGVGLAIPLTASIAISDIMTRSKLRTIVAYSPFSTALFI